MNLPKEIVELQHPIVHTPGPWKYHDSGSIVMTADGQMSVADIRGFGRLEKDFGLSSAIKIMDKNGQLIAACPVMVEALQDAIRLVRHLGGNPCCQIKALETAGLVV